MYFLLLNGGIFPSFKMSTHMTTRNLIKRSYYESDQEDDLLDDDYFPSSEKLVTDESLDDDSDEEYLPNYHCKPFRTEDAQSNRSNPFISAPKGGILNENWCKKKSSIPTKASTNKVKKQQTVKLSIGRLSLRKH